MELDVQSFKRVDLVKLSGRIDSSNAPELDTALKNLAREHRHQVVIDLSGIDYMSSAGLRALVSGLRENRKHNGDLVIANPSERMREILSLAGLDSVFHLYDDPVAAVASY
ncbi:MAG: STAS domain-containing protein [Candidatus Promineifilaceae bacterium]